MNNRIFSNYLSRLKSSDSFNKVVVSLFIDNNHLSDIKNHLINKNILTQDNVDYDVYIQIKNQLTKENINFGFCEIIELFEYIIPKEEKSKNGIVYTPEFIKQYIIENVFKNKKSISDILVCDLSCGCGGFLFTASRYIKEKTGGTYFQIFKNNIFGLDLTSYSIERVKILLTLLAIDSGEDNDEFLFNLIAGNALNFDWINSFSCVKENGGFDIIIGNPPYVTARNIESESKQLLDKWTFSKVGNTDLYIIFFEIALRFLKNGGRLGYITVNTFYRSLNARLLRKHMRDNRYSIKIIDFGHEQVFSKKSTYTCLFFLEKSSSLNIRYTRTDSKNIAFDRKLYFNSIPYSHLNTVKGWTLCDKNTYHKIIKIEKTGQPLGEKYKISTGLATLKNHIYIFQPIVEDEKYYYLKTGQTLFPIEKEICRKVVNANKIFNNANHDERIIFPYLTSDGSLSVMSDDLLESQYPNTFYYLKSFKDILSTRDKGSGKYAKWYAYGRSQSLLNNKKKLLLPHITKKVYSRVVNNEDLLFYNGQAIYSQKVEDLLILQKVLESKVFWYYIKNISRPYSGGFYSLSKEYIKNFGCYSYTDQEKDFILHCEDEQLLDTFILDKYKLVLDN